MKLFVLTTWLLMSAAAAGGERERGLRLYREGQFAEAQAAFEAALAEEPDSSELQWNLALAAWRAGNLDVAEVAAEKYAAQAENARPELHRGLLGAVRFAEATQLEQAADQLLQQNGTQQPGASGAAAGSAAGQPDDPLPIYEQALQKAMQAKMHFVRGVRAKATPELVRNTERVLRKIDSLTKRIEELMSQRQPNKQEPDPSGDQQDKDQQDKDQQDGDQQDKDKQDAEPSQDKQKPDGEKPEEDPSKERPPEEEKQPGEGGEPDPGESEAGEPQPGEEAPEPEPSKPAGQNSEEQKPEEASEGQSGEGSPPETPEPSEEDEPKPGEGAAQAGDKPGEPAAPRQDAPGEGVEGRKLSPEEAQRVMERLKEIDKKMKAARARARGRRRKVGRDW